MTGLKGCPETGETKPTALDRPTYIDIDQPLGYDLVEPKADGMWLTLAIAGGQATGHARSGRERMRRTIDTDRQAVFVGEYIVGTTRAKGHPQHGHVVAFDLLELDGVDVRGLPLRDRRAKLMAIIDDLGIEWLHATPQYPVALWKTLWKSHVADGEWEGVVFKRSDSAYGDDWARRKRHVTADYVCTGFNYSTSGRYAGEVCSVVGALPAGKTISVPGLSESQRLDFKAHAERYVGQTFEAAGKDHTPSGSLRHPTFCRWRTACSDKTGD